MPVINEIEISTTATEAGRLLPPATVLSVQGVSKKFCRNLKRSMYYAIKDIAGEILGFRRKIGTLRQGEFWAIDDISFELKKGDAIALVGANGAGKTTMLKIINGLIKPDKGSVQIRGRIAPLIALGAGFNPVLSGRENIFVNMSILGLSKRQIEERFNEVVDFAEIRHAIDAPVQTYSSGMSARLGFACAIHADPDILLIDEVLAVGDMKFRAKCYRKLADIRKKGASFLLVSHSVQSLLSVCSSGIFIAKGKFMFQGSIESTISQYENSLLEDSNESDLPKNFQSSDNEISFTAINLLNEKGEEVKFINFGNACSFQFIIRSSKKIDFLKMILIIRSNTIETDYMLSLDSSKDDFFFNLEIGENKIEILFPVCGLREGSYSLKAAISGENHYILDAVESFNFRVKNLTRDINSTFYQERNWRLTT